MSDQEIIDAASEAHRQGYPVTDLQARVIASAWHGGQASALYSLASTGAITDRTLTELERESAALTAQEAEAEGLDALYAYCLRAGNRGPRDGWSNLHW